ncbi:MAG TPA: peptide deformylase [Acidimicrobiales bacterium]|nr:peptide deformylase [Acidimicrobiales bacterium]
MAVRPVVRLPEAVLTRVARPVEGIDADARALAADLVDTMRASPACIGLAAPQIGVGLRAFAVDVSSHKKATRHHGEFVMFNPVVLVAEAPVLAREGCMSVPDLTGDVPRATHVVLRGLTPDGEDRVIAVEGFEARAVLHEMDHLDGMTFLDRVAGHDAVFRRKVYR